MPIRDATVADRAAIVRTARASFDRVYAFFAVRGTRRAWPFLVADDGSSIQGFLEGILFRGTPPIGYVYFVAVDLRARGMGSGRGPRPGIAPALPVPRSRPGVCGRAEGQRSVDAPVRVPRVRAGRPSGPVAVVPLARVVRADADALGSPRGPPRAHFHRPPSRVASRGLRGLLMAGELAHARLDHRRVRGLRLRLDGPLVVERAGRASD